MNNLRMPLIGLAAVCIVGLSAYMLFSSKKKSSTEDTSGTSSNAPVESSTPPQVILNVTPPQSVPVAPSTVPAQNTAVSSSTGSSPSSTPAPSGNILYEVKPGDMLAKIAKAHGCTLKDIYAVNKGLSDATAASIRPGQKIVVPDKKGIGGTPAPASKVESVTSPVETASGTVSGTSPSPASASTEPAPVVAVPVPKELEPESAPALVVECRHTLAVGDTIYSLSKKYYGTVKYWSLISKANPDWKAGTIEVGREVVIPALNPSGTKPSTTGVKSGDIAVDIAPSSKPSTSASSVVPNMPSKN